MHLPNPSISQLSAQPLSTRRLVLQPLTWEDVSDIFQLHQYAEVVAFNNLQVPRDLQSTRDLLRPILEPNSHGHLRHLAWTIRSQPDRAFRGAIGLSIRRGEPNSADLYYEIEPPYWGRGLATESVQRVLSFAFGVLHLQRIKALSATQNIRSIRVLEKVGMQKIGFRRAILPERGIWQDNYEFAIQTSSKS